MITIQIIHSVVMIVGFFVLFFYQRAKINSLEVQNKSQNELLGSMKIFFDMMNPELIKTRVELLERNLEKESKFKIEEITKGFEEEIGRIASDAVLLKSVYESALGTITEAFLYLPNETRKKLIADMKDEALKKKLEAKLPFYEEQDKKRKKALHEIFVTAIEETFASGTLTVVPSLEKHQEKKKNQQTKID